MTIHDYRKWVPKQAADKRWAQTGHERWEPQELKLVPNPSSQEEGKHVALDWYNTVYQNGWVPPENLEGLKLLQDHGFTLLSFEWGSITIRRRQRWVASWNGYRPTRLASSSMMTGSSGRVLAQWGLGVCSAPKPQEKQFSCLQECAAGSSACGTSSKSMIGVEELAAWNVQLLNILNCSMA